MLGDKPRFIDGDEVRFSCDRNYDLFGSATLRCVGKKWNFKDPVCKGEFPNGFTAARDLLKLSLQTYLLSLPFMHDNKLLTLRRRCLVKISLSKQEGLAKVLGTERAYLLP